MTANSATDGALLDAISDGARSRPVLTGSYTDLAALAGRLRDPASSEYEVVATPAARGVLLAVDAAGLLWVRRAATSRCRKTRPCSWMTAARRPGRCWQNHIVGLAAEGCFTLGA